MQITEIKNQANTKTLDQIRQERGDLPVIQPWSDVKAIIAPMIGVKIQADADAENDDTSGKQPVEQATDSMMANSSTLSHGFQTMRTMEHSMPTVRSVLYIPHSAIHVSLDANHVHMWKGAVKLHKLTATPPRDKNLASVNQSGLSKDKYLSGLMGISKWMYDPSKRIYIVATKQLQIKILGNQFEEISCFSNPLPTLCICKTPNNDFLFGEVGGIRVSYTKADTYNQRH